MDVMVRWHCSVWLGLPEVELMIAANRMAQQLTLDR